MMRHVSIDTFRDAISHPNRNDDDMNLHIETNDDELVPTDDVRASLTAYLTATYPTNTNFDVTYLPNDQLLIILDDMTAVTAPMSVLTTP